jgi:hypothetical protein
MFQHQRWDAPPTRQREILKMSVDFALFFGIVTTPFMVF